MKISGFKFIIPLAALAVSSCATSYRKQNSKTGFVKVSDLTLVSSDLQNMYAPSKGNVKMLVIPIAFTGSAKDEYNRYTDWTSDRLTEINKYYFGKAHSLASYYANASLGNLKVEGMVSSVYQNSTIKSSTINNDNTYQSLFDLIENAITWVEETQTGINWSEYDLNRDGCIDNVHLITNYNASEWNTPLWPHMYNTGRTGTLEKPLANVYSISANNFVSNAITSIHEQGHIFGLDDYYDYTSAASDEDGVDYIGHLDMQSYNCFDWNSFSKLSMGWVKPYVINGEADVTTINIKAASINGDCILIPADYSTWNGSAFDEYFLLELFAPYGNNKEDWNAWSGSLGKKSGIRLYHVDARVYGSNSRTYNPSREEYDYEIEDLEEQEINSKEDVAKWQYNVRGANNSANWVDYPSGIEQLGDYPLLSLAQRGGDFTFAKPNGRHTLNATDLFKAGDEFTFEKYSKFLNKQGVKQELMNNGEEFPYSFVVDYLDDADATITFTKVKR